MTHDSLLRELDACLPNSTEQEREWRLRVFPAWRQMFPSISRVCQFLRQPERLLQENSRGVVFLLQLNGLRFIAKRSLRQERRWWLQFTSLYRGGEAARSSRNLARLTEAGLPVPPPVFVLERQRFGMTVASWACYQYVDGTTCTCEDAEEIARMLRRIHSAGWVHRDPHVQNFLRQNGEIRILDCARARPWRSRYAQMYDVVLLDNCCPNSVPRYGISERDLFFRLAKAQNNLLKSWRRFKRRLRYRLSVKESFNDFTVADYSGYLSSQYDLPAFREQLRRFFDADLKTCSPLTAYPDREVYALRCQASALVGVETVYLKRYLLIGAKQIAQAFFRYHKAQRAWRIANIMQQEGIPTPRPVAFLRRQTWGRVNEFVVITEGITSGLSLRQYVRQWLYAQPQSARMHLKRRLIRRVAEFLAALHLSGIYHGDLTANNIFIESLQDHDIRVYLLDLDSVRSFSRISHRRRIKNLEELGRNFLELPIISTTDRVRFLTRYLARYGGAETLPELFSEVWQQTQFRLRKHRQQFVRTILPPLDINAIER